MICRLPQNEVTSAVNRLCHPYISTIQVNRDSKAIVLAFKRLHTIFSATCAINPVSTLEVFEKAFPCSFKSCSYFYSQVLLYFEQLLLSTTEDSADIVYCFCSCAQRVISDSGTAFRPLVTRALASISILCTPAFPDALSVVTDLVAVFPGSSSDEEVQKALLDVASNILKKVGNFTCTEDLYSKSFFYYTYFSLLAQMCKHYRHSLISIPEFHMTLRSAVSGLLVPEKKLFRLVCKFFQDLFVAAKLEEKFILEVVNSGLLCYLIETTFIACTSRDSTWKVLCLTHVLAAICTTCTRTTFDRVTIEALASKKILLSPILQNSIKDIFSDQGPITSTIKSVLIFVHNTFMPTVVRTKRDI